MPNTSLQRTRRQSLRSFLLAAELDIVRQRIAPTRSQVPKPLLYIYAAISIGVHILAFRQSVKDREPLYVLVLELASALFVVTGVVAYTLGLHHGLTLVWRALGPPFVATYLWLAAVDVLAIVKARDPEFTVLEDRITTAVGLLLAVLLLGPGLWLNLLVALGR